ncbi:MAG: thioredoxin domain-containing protein [Ilumatobacteraceae bacterium]|nr:thioredoxin domain-containing protein [Ilumatobacteraceae bacterium]
MPNLLAASTSPYLRQHQDNPVHWQEWGADAFAQAAQRNVPILLSVGYSACHWCHVMAHECFEDSEVADMMNSLFVNVKVDREERPDIDAIYMDAVQAMTGRGGWPMTVFLTPTGEPFYGGTYFPKPSFMQLMGGITEIWRDKQDDVAQNVTALMESLGRTALISPAESYDADALLVSGLKAVASNFDPTWGGFGTAPKFPSTFAIDLLLRAYAERKDDTTRTMAQTSLDAMAAGGIYDHLGGGFARYSVDAQWLAPHFEKMLYDQALLVRVYTHAWQLFGDDRYAQVVDETLTYLLRDLTHLDGGFYSAQDADSLDADGHSHEGAFYTWTPQQVSEVLGADSDKAFQWWDITESGNFEGVSIPNRIANRTELLRPDDIEALRVRLFEARSTRTYPGLDNKVLTEWNAMMLASLCEAATAFNRPDWLAAAQRNGLFLLNNLFDGHRWLRSWNANGTPPARHQGLAHDYVQVVDAMTRLAEATGQTQFITAAIATADSLIEHFWDPVNGGFFTSPNDAEQLVVRQKDLMDNATPSANSSGALALLRLAALTGNSTYHDHARQIFALLARVAPSAPTAFCNFMLALHTSHVGITQVVVTGDRPDLLAHVRSSWRPSVVLAWGQTYDSPLWQHRAPDLAYVCRDYACHKPSVTVDDLRIALATTDSI